MLLVNTLLFYTYSSLAFCTNTFFDTTATFYFRVGENKQGCPEAQTFNDGNFYGPCGINSQGIQYTGEAQKYIVAIKDARQHCNKVISAFFEGNSVNLTVGDNCFGCSSDNHLDMSLDALIELTGSKENACAINRLLPRISWKFV